MNNKILVAITILSLSIASVALIVGILQTNTIIAEDAPKGNNVYIFAEGVSPQATFKFRDATVTYDFQIFSQTQGFGNNGRTTTPEFTLTRIAGETPYLYEAVDQTHDYTTKTNVDYPYKEFDVRVDLIQAGETIRSLDYQRCSISNYRVDTRTDNEEGYTTGGKTGFAVTDIYTFSCAGYKPLNPLYDTMIEEKQNTAPYE